MLFDKSYSASKGETALTWTTVLRHRFAYVFQFLFPFYEYLISYGVSSGLLSAPGFFDDPEIKMAWLGDPIQQFTGPRPPSLDLEKEIKGLVLARDAGFQSTRGTIEETSGNDPDQVFRELEEERERGIFGAIVKEIVDSQEKKEDEDEERD
jgi:capsid protein